MKKILFRAKDVDTKRWIEGYYIHLHKSTYVCKEDYERHPDNDIHRIVYEQMTDWCLPNKHLMTDIDPETLGQYTGLKDINGKKIFEGDVVKEGCNGLCAAVYFDESHGCYGLKSLGDTYKAENSHIEWEIIGNIHDNPELLDGGDTDAEN